LQTCSKVRNTHEPLIEIKTKSWIQQMWQTSFAGKVGQLNTTAFYKPAMGAIRVIRAKWHNWY